MGSGGCGVTFFALVSSRVCFFCSLDVSSFVLLTMVYIARVIFVMRRDHGFRFARTTIKIGVSETPGGAPRGLGKKCRITVLQHCDRVSLRQEIGIGRRNFVAPPVPFSFKPPM